MANQPEMASKATINIEKVDFMTQSELDLQENQQNSQKSVKKRHKIMKVRLLQGRKSLKKALYTKKYSQMGVESTPLPPGRS